MRYTRHLPTLFLSAGLLLAALPASADTLGPQRIGASNLLIHDIIGTVTVATDANATGITITINGEPDELALLSVGQKGDAATITRSRPPSKIGRDWNVKNDDIVIDITMPKDGNVTVSDMMGTLHLSDLDGKLVADISTAADITTGTLASASFTVSGAAGIKAGTIQGPLSLVISGACNFDGAGVQQGLRAQVSGFGNISTAQTRGPVDIQISGVGDIDMRDGDTDMLRVSISGMAGVDYEGEVRNRDIDVSGLSSIHINGEKAR